MSTPPSQPGSTPSNAAGIKPLPSLRAAPKSPSEALKPVAVAAPQAPRRRRRSPFIALMSGLFTVALLLLGVLGAGGLMLSSQATAPGPLVADKAVLIPRDSGLGDITDILTREGIVDQPWAFRLSAITSGDLARMKAGEYLFKANVSAKDALGQIVRGEVIRHSITIPEGLTSEQIVARLRENDLLIGDVTQIPREGSLMPDTVRFERGQTRQDIINRMQSEQRRILREIWAKRAQDLPIKTEQELVILASIVEKETGRADERPRVAGAFINRLNRKMKLQSDPTIVYGLVGGKGTLGRGILRAEIIQATPYNTYVIDGLPPGPIANPGRPALEAVANPSRTKDVFFVADGTGGHAFAETLEQHNRNVARWRQVEASRRDPGRPPAEASVDKVEPPPEIRSEAPAVLPGRANALAPVEPPAPIETFPVPANRRTGQAGVGQTASGQLPPSGTAARSRSLDASEGTARDPLRNRTFDLNNPQVVPSLRP
jgi:UPF0755 protein